MQPPERLEPAHVEELRSLLATAAVGFLQDRQDEVLLRSEVVEDPRGGERSALRHGLQAGFWTAIHAEASEGGVEDHLSIASGPLLAHIGAATCCVVHTLSLFPCDHRVFAAHARGVRRLAIDRAAVDAMSAESALARSTWWSRVRRAAAFIGCRCSEGERRGIRLISLRQSD